MRTQLLKLSSVLLVTSPLAFAQANQPPVVSTGGNSGVDYRVDCNNDFQFGGAVTSVQLDGSASFDPNGTPVTFFWHNECKFGWLDDPTSPAPVYHVNMEDVCERECWIALRVTSGGQTTIKGFRVIVEDVTAPTLSIPVDIVGIWGDDPSPAETGFAAASDNCDPNPVLTYTDVVIPPTGPGQPELTIQRTWNVVDCTGRETSAIQWIRHLAPTGGPGADANMDFDPTMCPNIFALSESGQIDVLILGSPSFRADQIVPSSVRLRARHLPGVEIAPVSFQLNHFGSVAASVYGECQSTVNDGERDLRVRFDRATIGTQLNLSGLVGNTIELTITGNLTTSKLFGTRDFATVQ